MAAKKKSFKAELESNPALTFISTAEEQTPEPEPTAAEPARRIYPRQETKSRRWQVLIRPSLHEAVCNEAERRGISVNAALNDVLAEYFAEHK